MKAGVVKFLGHFIVAYILLFISFSSVVWHESAHHDNTRYFRVSSSEEFKSSCYNDSQYGWLYIIGRPMTAEIECKVFKYTKQLKDLSTLRVFVIGFIAAAAAILSLVFLRFGLDKGTSLFISVAIFSLPGMQNAAFMTNFSNAISPIVALAAFLFLCYRLPFYPIGWNGEKLARSALAVVMLIGSALIYPSLSFTFFWGGIVRALTYRSNDWIDQVLLFVRDTTLFGIAMVSALFLKNAVVPEAFKAGLASIPESFQADFSILSIVGKIPFLFVDAVPTASSLWFIQKGIFGYSVIALILLSITLLIVLKKKNSTDYQVTPLNILIAFIFFIFTFAPLILSKAPMMHQRVLMPSTGAFVILFSILIPSAIALVTYNSIRINSFRGVACLVVSLGLIASSYTLSKNVWNTNIEMMFARYEIAKLDRLPRRIHLITAIDNNIGFDGLSSRSDEFHRKTTDYKQDIVDFLRLSLFGSDRGAEVPLAYCDPSTTDCDVAVPKGQVIVSFSDYEQKYCRSDDMILIDMNLLVRATRTGRARFSELKSIPYCDTEKLRVSDEATSTKKPVSETRTHR